MLSGRYWGIILQPLGQVVVVVVVVVVVKIRF
jgi:hypothetical protein